MTIGRLVCPRPRAGGAAGHQHHVGGDHRLDGVAEEDADGEIKVGMAAQRILEQHAGLAGGKGHRAGAGVTLVERGGGGDVGVGEVAHLGLPAARQEGEHRAARGDLQGFAHRSPVGHEGEDIGRMAHVAHRHPGRPVELGLGEQAQHVAHRAGDAFRRPRRQAQIDGLTKWMAGMPRSLRRFSSHRLKSGGIHADEGGRRVFAKLASRLLRMPTARGSS